MFTGLIESTGVIARKEQRQGGIRLWVQSAWFSENEHDNGASIAVNGVCLTLLTDMVENADEGVFDVSAETLNKTTLGSLATKSIVNLESALTLNTPLGGHLVSGHVDGIGYFNYFEDDGDYKIAHFKVDDTMGRFIAHKGSVCIDGVSLTSNNVHDDSSTKETYFTVALVPHTLEVTNIGQYRPNTACNIEVDVIARYSARLQQFKDEM